jgi:hypothetical protein
MVANRYEKLIDDVQSRTACLERLIKRGRKLSAIKKKAFGRKP